jgi:hypothetical protein
MSPDNHGISRRDFLRGAAGLTLFAATGFSLDLSAEEKSKYLTRVVLVRDKDVFGKEDKINSDVLARMLDHAVSALYNGQDAGKVWKQLFSPADLVGVKSNWWGRLRTPPELEDLLKLRLMEAGVPDDAIAVADQKGVRQLSVFKKSTALINARPMRTHHWAGVGSLIKNYISFVEVPSDYHDEYCSPLGSIWNMPHIKGKTRLNILVVLQPLFHGIGPHHYDHQHVWKYCGLLVGLDPVAVDTIGLKLIEARRREFFGEDRPLTPPAIHIARADTEHGVGTSDMEKIELVKLGWEEGVLI